MTAQTTVTYSDDLGGAGAATPLNFSIGEEKFEIHLNKRNMETFLRRMETYTSVAHTPEAEVTIRRKRNRSSDEQSKRIREWALANGYKIGAKGRIPSEITAAYLKPADLAY